MIRVPAEVTLTGDGVPLAADDHPVQSAAARALPADG